MFYNKFTFYIPRKIDHHLEEMLEFEKSLNDNFGGFTRIDNCKGSWVNSESVSVRDDIVLYVVITKSTFITGIIDNIKATLNQECMLVTCESVNVEFL